MPATYTHHIFTEDVFKVINPDIKTKLESSIDIYKLFGKSFDIFYFTGTNIGYLGHHKNINLYFKNIINYIKENNLENDSQVLAYLYGSICHYILDSTIHPYIFYKTGKFNRQDKKTYKYRGLHNYYEYMIDAIFYLNRNKKPIYKTNLTKEIFTKYEFSSNLDNTINKVFYETHNVKNASKILKKGIRYFKFMMRYAMEVHTWFKYYLYKIIDKLHIFKDKKLTCCSYYIRNIDISVLNVEHKKWCYPVDNKTSYHYSMIDLYDLCIEKARKLINLIDEAINSNDEKILNKAIKEIGDIDYSTGKRANKKYKKLTFEF